MQPNYDRHPRKACLWTSCTAVPPSHPPQCQVSLWLTEAEWEKPLRALAERRGRRTHIIVCLYCSTICTALFGINYTLSIELGAQLSKPHQDHCERQQTIPQNRLFPHRFLAEGRTSDTRRRCLKCGFYCSIFSLSGKAAARCLRSGSVP